MPFALLKSLLRCSSIKTSLDSCTRIPSQTPSPNKNPLSNTDILASFLLNKVPLIFIKISWFFLSGM